MSAYTPPGSFPAPASGSSTPAAEESLEGLAITIINAFTSGIKPSVTSMLIAMALTGAMVPLLCAVFLFSSSTLRRKPVFALNVFAVFMAMAMGLTIVWFGVCLIFRPFDNNNNALFTASVFVSTTSLVVGSILIVRLVAVYPPSKLSWPALCVVYGPPIVLKIARAVNCGVFLHRLWIHIKRDGLQAGEVSWHLPGSKAEIVMQMVDNSYMSIMFLWKLRRTTRSVAQSATVRVGTSYAKRIRTLIWIGSSNFIIPDLLSLTQLIFLLVDSDYQTGFYMMLLFVINGFVEVAGLLFATIWAASNHWQSGQNTTTDLEARTLTLPGRGGVPSSMDSMSVLRGVETKAMFPEKVDAVPGEVLAPDLGVVHAI